MSSSTTGSSSAGIFDSGSDVKQQAVMATNDDAFESKIAAMDAGYFEDRFLHCMKHQIQNLRNRQDLDIGIDKFVERRQRQFFREPVINRGTFGRILIKQHIMGATLDELANTHTHVQVVSLGAGFDTFAFNLLRQDSDIPVLNYLELDLEPVVRQKLELAQDFLQDGGGEVLAWEVERHESRCFHAKMCKSGSQYWLKSCDLSDLSELSKVFSEVGLVRDNPTIILAELSLVYMAVDESDAVIRWLGTFLTGRRTFVCLEPLQGTDRFGKHMDRNVAARGSPFLSMRVYGDVDAQRKRFEKNGWSSVRARTMWDEWRQLISPRHMMELQKVELLDEVEELTLLLAHYCIIVAAVGQTQQQSTTHDNK